jgi:hypothetical protein
LLAAVLTFGLLVAGTAGLTHLPGPLQTSVAGAATPAQEQEWLGRINELRAGRGLAPLTVDAEQNALAQQRAQTNSNTGALAHTPSLSAGVSATWLKLGENVGVGPSIDVVFSAFVQSPQHFANLTDPAFTHVGIGVTVDGQGRIWVTHRFLQLGAAPAPRPAPAPVPTLAPRPAPPTTPPPSSATTAPPSTPGDAEPDTGTGTGPNGDVSADPGSTTRPARVAAMLDALYALPR